MTYIFNRMQPCFHKYHHHLIFYDFIYTFIIYSFHQFKIMLTIKHMSNGCFQSSVQQNRKKETNTFVDKTLHIIQLHQKFKGPILFVRPNLYGKTYIIDMLQKFYSPTYQININGFMIPKFGRNSHGFYFDGVDDNGNQIFEPLNIVKDYPQFYKNNHGNIPVLVVPMYMYAGKNISEYIEGLRSTINRIYQGHLYLVVALIMELELNREQTQFIRNLVSQTKQKPYSPIQKMDILYSILMTNPTFTNIIESEPDFKYFHRIHMGEYIAEIQLLCSISLLVKLMHRFYKRNVILLVDNFTDNITSLYLDFIDQGYSYITKQFIKQAVIVITNLFKNVEKECSSFIHNIFMFGVADILLDLGENKLNNVTVNSLGSFQFQTLFGFTLQEVKKLVEIHAKSKNLCIKLQNEIFMTIKQCYGGQGQEKKNIIDAWSIISYLNELTVCQYKKIRMPLPYWVRNLLNCILKSYLLQEQTYLTISSITHQNPLISQTPLLFSYRKWDHTGFLQTFLKYQKVNEDMLIFILLRHGYLTEILENQQLMGVRIRNRDIGAIFQKSVHQGWLTNIMGQYVSQNTSNQKILPSFCRTFYDPTEFSNTIKRYVLHKVEGEKTESSFRARIYAFLHMGLLTNHFEAYSRLDYRKSGKRIDTLFVPASSYHNKWALIYECKVNSSMFEERNEKLLQQAEWQCYLNNYLSACNVVPIHKLQANIFVRSCVFWKNDQTSEWQVAIKDRKIPVDKYKCIINLFEAQNLYNALSLAKIHIDQRKNLRTQFIGLKGEGRESLLRYYDKGSLDELINWAISGKSMSKLKQESSDWYEKYGLYEECVRDIFKAVYNESAEERQQRINRKLVDQYQEKPQQHYFSQKHETSITKKGLQFKKASTEKRQYQRKNIRKNEVQIWKSQKRSQFDNKERGIMCKSKCKNISKCDSKSKSKKRS